MIQATPFDLALLTAATDEPIQDRVAHHKEVYTQFAGCRDRSLDTNRRLAENPALTDNGLRVPLTETLFGQLCK